MATTGFRHDGGMEPQRRDDDFDPRWDGDPEPQGQWDASPGPGGQWDGSPDPRPLDQRGAGHDDDPHGDNLFMKYRAVWAVLITLITLLVCWQILQVVLEVGI